MKAYELVAVISASAVEHVHSIGLVWKAGGEHVFSSTPWHINLLAVLAFDYQWKCVSWFRILNK